MLNTEFEQFLDESGNLHFNEDATLVDYVERNVRDQADTLAYRFIDYSRERDGEAQDLTWAQFGKRLRAVAARLQQVTKPGDRVAILAPQSLEYVIGFFSALYASNVAVPLFSPDEPGHTDRLTAVLADCKPTAILTSTKSAEAVRDFFAPLPAKERPRVIAVDAVPDSVGSSWVAPVAGKDHNRDTVAYLQYTSGSTRNPAGVMITNEALVTDIIQINEALENYRRDGDMSPLRDAMKNGYGDDMYAADFADMIKKRTDWDGETPIRLFSCDTGARPDGFAQQLSTILKVDVTAPTKPVWSQKGGAPFVTDIDPVTGAPVIPPNGTWVTFSPKE